MSVVISSIDITYHDLQTDGTLYYSVAGKNHPIPSIRGLLDASFPVRHARGNKRRNVARECER